MAVVAQVDETNLFGLVDGEVLEARFRNRGDVRHDLAMGTRDGEVLRLVVDQAAGEVNIHRHCVAPVLLLFAGARSATRAGQVLPMMQHARSAVTVEPEWRGRRQGSG